MPSEAPEPLETILLVDDRKDNLLALQAVLEPLCLEMQTASSGGEALRYLLDHEVAAIVLDVQMPGLDGFETADLLRARAATRGIPIIFLTAISHDLEHQLRGYDAGAVDYISKPFEPDLLRAKVRALVEMSSALRAAGAARSAAEVAARESETVDGGGSWTSAPRAEVGAAPFLESVRVVDLDVAADGSAPRTARAAVRSALGEAPELLVEAAVLLVSELVTNSVVHARSAATVRIDLGPTVLRGEVADAGAFEPNLREATVEDDSGRGLEIVRQMADRCGWTRSESGKVVWFELSLPAGRP
ncbi:MAG TPA: response regulator [Acidimicrobiales bacterium]|nr:response regulator [Acidimicrobiales bacterium]